MPKAARALFVLGSVLLLIGVIAGVANREVLDGSRFAGHVDAIRTDPAVSRQAGIVITRTLTDAAPDLTVARPLLESTTGALVGSPAFGPVIRGAVTPMHRAFTDDSSDHIVLRLADVGAVLVAALTTLAPQAAKSLPPNLDITLASFGGQDFAGDVIGAAHWVKLLSWLLPLLALLCFAGGVLLTRDRLRGLRAVGLAIATSGLVLAALTFVGSIFASRINTDTLLPALGAAAWSTLSPELWIASAVVVAAGYVLALGSVMRLGANPRDYVAKAIDWLL
ncbi:MAG: hypothetical protein JWR83_2958, partial [Aeromicrobium sp.]|nr:hypothetical protein [Aeromicrobium sp.]